MTPKETIRSSRKAQQFHSSSKPGMHEPPPLSPRDWLGAMAGWHRSIERDDFSNADLHSARLTKIFFRRCVFAGTKLDHVALDTAEFTGCTGLPRATSS